MLHERALFWLNMLALVSLVSAHGYVGQIAIDGKWYAGNQPNNYAGPSPIRLVSDIGPVKGASNPDLMCGLSAQKAELVVPANPGSVFSALWVGGDGISNWPHNTGPLMTYMTSCGDTTCDKFDPTGAEWFKIDQLGRKSDNSTWFQEDIKDNRDAYEVKLPQDLAPGGYLIRHEIIALHLAVSVGGAEFYPSCTQVLIGGSGSGSPSPTVNFPGAYSDTDPGIFDPSVFDTGSDYTFPGGAIANLAGTNQQVVSGPQTTPAFPSGTDIGTPAPAPSTSAQTEPSRTPTGTPSASASASPNPAPSGSSSATGSTPSDTRAPSSSTCSLKRRNRSNPQKKRHLRRSIWGPLPHMSH